jgi:hypothetical protein
MIEPKPLARKHAVLVRLSDREQEGLDFLREREALPKAQILRRLLIREIRAGQRIGTQGVLEQE